MAGLQFDQIALDTQTLSGPFRRSHAAATTAARPSPSAALSSDRDFAQKAAYVAWPRSRLRSWRNDALPQVKQFAQRMITDRTAANTELQQSRSSSAMRSTRRMPRGQVLRSPTGLDALGARLAALTNNGTLLLEKMTPTQRIELKKLQDFERRVATKDYKLQDELLTPVEETIQQELFSRKVQ